MKFHLFYLKQTNQLYAFTSVKAYAKLFLSQRNPECFKVKIIKLSGEDEKIFMYTHRLKQLSKFPFQTGVSTSEYAELIATPEEDNKISDIIEVMEKQALAIHDILKKVPVKNKYKESILNLVCIYDNDGNILLDVLSLFIDTFKDTFIKSNQII